MEATQAKPLSPRQRDAFEVVRNHIGRHGYAPTLDYIAADLGISRPSVWELLHSIARKGWIVLGDKEGRKRRHRSISLPGLCPCCGRKME